MHVYRYQVLGTSVTDSSLIMSNHHKVIIHTCDQVLTNFLVGYRQSGMEGSLHFYIEKEVSLWHMFGKIDPLVKTIITVQVA